MKKKYLITIEVEAIHPSNDEEFADREMREFLAFELQCNGCMNANNQTEDFDVKYFDIEEL